MQKFFVFIALLATFLPSSPSMAQDITPPHPTAPAIRTMSIAEISDYATHCDHPLIVNFWATYCTPCLKEIPYFQDIVARYRDKKVELMMVSLDMGSDHRQRIAAIVQKEKIVATLVWTDANYAGYNNPVFDKNWSGGLPASLFINNHTHYRRFFDRQLTDRQVEQEIKLLVAP
jgi:thiol-disulfide isomerase/thioredoxin